MGGHLQRSHAQVMVTVNLFIRSLYIDLLELSYTANSNMATKGAMSRTIRT